MKINYNGIVRDMTAEEEEQYKVEQDNIPAPEPTAEEKIAELEKQNEMLTECLFELASIIYA